MRIGPEPGALDGLLTVPAHPRGAVVLLYGDAGIRHAAPPSGLAEGLRATGLATLQANLLTQDELAEDVFTKHRRFDVRRQAPRLHAILAWLRGQPWAAGLPVSCFATGASGAAALIADAARPGELRAIAMWGGRPDLAGRALAGAVAPSLLLVERHNAALLDLNRAALPLLAAERRLADLGDPSELPPLLIAWLEGHGAAADAERAVGAA
mgnify:CR=1 FL=1